MNPAENKMNPSEAKMNPSDNVKKVINTTNDFSSDRSSRWKLVGEIKNESYRKNNESYRTDLETPRSSIWISPVINPVSKGYFPNSHSFPRPLGATTVLYILQVSTKTSFSVYCM